MNLVYRDASMRTARQLRDKLRQEKGPKAQAVILRALELSVHNARWWNWAALKEKRAAELEEDLAFEEFRA